MFNRFFLLLVLSFYCYSAGYAQDTAAMHKEALRLEAAFKDEQALNKYLELLKYDPSNVNILCRIAELYSLAGKLQPTTDQQNSYYRNARTYAQKALAVNAKSSEANVMMAIAMGRMALIASGKEKINAVRAIKVYAEKAIQLDATSFKAYHVLGKWHQEVSELSGATKWLVKVTYGALPKASLEEALRNYEKCRQLNPAFLLNYLEMARVYRLKDDDQKAISALEAMLKLPNKTSNDESIRKEGKKLLDELK